VKYGWGPRKKPRIKEKYFNRVLSNRNRMKTLHRSKKSKLLGGVCGGLGEYLDTDPNIIRIVVVVLLALGIVTLFWPLFCFVVYMAAWILLPEEPENPVTG
jgi:phage shock protein C